MRTNFIFGHGRIVAPAPKYAPKYALKYAFKNQTVKKEEKKPIAIAEDNENMAEGLKRHAILAELKESGLAQTQQTAETQNCNMQEDMDIADGIPRMKDTDMTQDIEQAGVAQSQPTPSTESAPAQKREKIALSEDEEERIEAQFLRNRYDPELREAQYKIKKTREHLINRIPENETREKLKISHQEYLNLVATVRLLDDVMYEIPEKIRKVRKLTIGDNGAIISVNNMKALGIYHMYPKESEAMPVIDPNTGWILLKPCSSPATPS